MKNIILSILLISCSFFPVFSKGSQEVLEQTAVIVTPNSIGEFEVGIDFETVQKQLGEEDEVFKDTYHFYHDLGLSFIVEGRTVIGITKFLDEGSAIIDGVEITNKMTFDEAKDFFKFSTSSRDSGNKLIVNNGTYHLEFYKNDKGILLLKELEIFM